MFRSAALPKSRSEPVRRTIFRLRATGQTDPTTTATADLKSEVSFLEVSGTLILTFA